MTHPLFYSTDVTGASSGQLVYLDPAGSAHAVRSQRLTRADPVFVSDGAGTMAQGFIDVVDPQRTGIHLETVTVHSPPAVRFNLIQALAKGDRDLLAVEMATELGVDAVTPWQAQRSIVRIRPDRAAKMRSKWEAKLHAAAQQSRRAFIPELGELVQADAIANLHVPQTGAYVIALHEDGRDTLQQAVAGMSESARRIYVVVGPEGGVSPDELAAVEAAGGSTVKIGTNVMRSSTAGPVAIALLNQLFNRW